ncbi:MAG: type I-U CRISPR-associated protein Csb2 [Microthrixaceae bacterium]
MLTIRVDLLVGTYYATAFNDRDRGEWPPHPARLFSALVAQWADQDPQDDDELAALMWLEHQGPPDLVCDDEARVARRAVLTNFVAVNDASSVGLLDRQYQKLEAAEIEALANSGSDRSAVKAQKALAKAASASVTASQREATKPGTSRVGLEVLPDERGKQPRTFPAVTPELPTVRFVWPAADPSPDQLRVLDALLGRVGRLGHSSSLVAVSLEQTDVGESAYRPDPAGDVSLRVPVAGLTEALRSAHQQHQGIHPRVLPNQVVTYSGGKASRPVPTGSYEDGSWVVLRIVPPEGGDEANERALLRDVPLTKSLPWSRSIRGAILRHASSENAYLGGHDAETGKPLKGDHPAVVALGFVDHEHADGRVSAFAVIPPRDITDSQWAALGAAMVEWRRKGLRLYTGRGGAVQLEVVEADRVSWAATPARWTQAGRMWRSVTPVALDRFPKGLRSDDPAKRRRGEAQASETVARAVTQQGLPAPARVWCHSASGMRGSAPFDRFVPYRHGGSKGRQLLSTHVSVLFDEPVGGPLLIGAGRHLGYGLMAPVAETADELEAS